MLKWEKGLALKECEGSVQVSRQTTPLDLACTLLSHHRQPGFLFQLTQSLQHDKTGLLRVPSARSEMFSQLIHHGSCCHRCC